MPQLWKFANITPISKESPFSECNQLRPISLTPIIMRIFEKAVYKKEIWGCLEQAIGPDQFAYKKNCNSTLALIKCQHYWLNSLDKKSNRIRVFSFDFGKAIDTVSHRIVHNKVKDLEINQYVINWLIDFLSNRKQTVAVDGNKTEFLDINRGVPQGTVLGPVLFSVMENDISPVEPDSCQLVKFADDVSLSIHIRERLTDISPLEVNNLINWSTQNNMKLNLKKTWEMVIRGKSKNLSQRKYQI